MLCPVCKAENSAEAVFCQRCGARVARKAPPVEVEVADEGAEPEVRVRSRPAADRGNAGDTDRPRRRRVIVAEDDRPSGGAIVPYRNPSALFAYYCIFLGFIVAIGATTAIAFYITQHGLNRPDEIRFCRTVVSIGFIAGIIFELAAFVLGIIGLLYVRKHPTARGTGHAVMGVILGPSLLIVELAALLFMIGWINSQFQ
jgi:hypothetical protein